MIKYFIIFFISISLYGQIVINTKSAELTFSNKIIGTVLQGSVGSDSVYINANRKTFIQSATGSSGLTNISVEGDSSILGPTKLSFDYNKSTPGIFNETIILNFSGINSPDTLRVIFEVMESGSLEYPTLLAFGTRTTGYSQDSFNILNAGTGDVTDLTHSGLSSPFSVVSYPTSINGESTGIVTIAFTPSGPGASFTDTLIFSSSILGLADSIIITGTYAPASTTTQWVFSGAGGGGWTWDMKIDPVNNSKMYASTDLSGFWYTHDGGISWESTNADTGGYEGSNLAVHPNGDTLLWANNAGVWKSTDAGMNWTRLGTRQMYGLQTYEGDLSSVSVGGTVDSANFSAVHFHPANSGTYWAGTGVSHEAFASDGQGFPNPMRIFKSTDYGVTWTRLESGVFNTSYNAVADIQGAWDDVNTVYVGTKQGLYKTSNGGSTWTNISTAGTGYGGRASRIAINPDNSNKIAVAKWTDDELYYTSNNGSSWTNIAGNLITATGSTGRICDVKWTADGLRLYASIVAASGYSKVWYVSVSNINGTSTIWIGMTSSMTAETWDDEYDQGYALDINDDASKIIFGFGAVNLYNTDNSSAGFVNLYSTEVASGYWRGVGADVSVNTQMKTSASGRVVIQAHQDHAGVISTDFGYSYRTMESILHPQKAIHTMAFSKVDTNLVYIWAGANNVKGVDAKLYSLNLTTLTATHVSNNIDNINAYADMLMTSSSTGRLWSITEGLTGFSNGNSGLFYSDPPYSTWYKECDVFYGDNMAYDEENEVLYATQQPRRATSLPIHPYGSVFKVTNANSSNPISSTLVNADGTLNELLYRATSVAVHPDSANTIYVTVPSGVQASAGSKVPDASILRGWTGNAGVMKSIDGGLTWRKVFSPQLANNPGEFTDISFDPTNPDIIYVSQNKAGRYIDISASDGIYMSDDYGVTWTDINYNLGLRAIHDIHVVENTGEVYIAINSASAFKLGKTTTAVSNPSIAGFSTSVDYGSSSITATMTVSNNGSSKNAYVGLSTSTSNIAITEQMTETSSNTFTYTYTGLSQLETYYLQGLFYNETAVFDTSSIDTVNWTALVQDSVIAYPAHNYDDGHYYTSYTVNSAFLLMGDNSGGADAVIRFKNITIPSSATIDSAKVIVTSHGNYGASAPNINAYAEDNLTPAEMGTLATYTSRTWTTAHDNWTSGAWTLGQTHEIDVTSSIQELVSSYTYTNNNVVIALKNNGSTSYVGIKSYDSGVNYPILKIYYSQ